MNWIKVVSFLCGFHINARINLFLISEEENTLLQLDYKNKFSGVLYVTKNGECILQKAYGYAEKGLKVRNFVLTRFNIASGGKLFTAVGILKLVEKEQLKLDDEISSIIPELPDKFKGITIHHLLTNTSGIGDYFDENDGKTYSKLWDAIPMYKMKDPIDFLPIIIDKDTISSPGAKYSYNNAGYILLGIVIERISKKPYKEYIRNTVFNPCKMSDSGYFKMNMLPPRTAYGYIKQEDETFRINIYDLPIIGGPDGGVYVTAVDMSKFWNELTSYELLSKELTNEIFKIHTDTNKPNIGYGYGVEIEHHEDEITRYFLDGFDPGANFRMMYEVDSDILVVAVSNEDAGTEDACIAIEKALVEEFGTIQI